jgi:hypothetical protein
MNIDTCQAIVNTIGISLTMIGAVLIAVDITRYFKGHANEPLVQQDPDSDDSEDMAIVIQPSKTKEYLQWEKTNLRLMFWGLVAILLGGALQIWASWII